VLRAPTGLVRGTVRKRSVRLQDQSLRAALDRKVLARLWQPPGWTCSDKKFELRTRYAHLNKSSAKSARF